MNDKVLNGETILDHVLGRLNAPPTFDEGLKQIDDLVFHSCPVDHGFKYIRCESCLECWLRPAEGNRVEDD